MQGSQPYKRQIRTSFVASVRSLPKTTMKNWLRIAVQRPIQITGLKMALLVGVLLNLINQGDALLAHELGSIQLGKLLLTFCVPYCVSVYSATQAQYRSKC